MLQTILCLIALTLQYCGAVQEQTTLKLIVLVSKDNDAAAVWAKGDQLVPGALLAAQEVNSAMSTSVYGIEPSLLWINNCNVEDALLQISQELFYSNTPVLGIAGLSCDSVNDAITQLVGREEVGVVQLLGAFASSTEIQAERFKRFSVLPMLETRFDAMLEFMKALNWNRIGLVIGTKKSSVVEAFEKRLHGQTFEILARLQLEQRIEHTVNQLTSSTAKIIVAFLSPDEAAYLLSHAFNNSLTWPEYVWILPDLLTNEVNEDILKEMENVIFLRTELQPSDAEVSLISNQSYSSYLEKVVSDSFNPFTNLLYDLVWAFGLAANEALEEVNLAPTTTNSIATLNRNFTARMETILLQNSFSGASGEFSFRADRQLDKSIEILQVQNESFALIAARKTGQNTTLSKAFIQTVPKPRDTLDRVYEFIPIPVSATLTAATLLCVLFVTIMLVVFFYYWNEPEMRASSRALSLCIFIGCYLILIASLAHTISSSIVVGPSLCIIILLCAAIGMDFLLATVLAKTLRIAYIFASFKKTGKMWSDGHLLGIILVIIAGKSIILILWSTVDFYHIIDMQEVLIGSDNLPFYNVYQSCYSEQIGVWLFLEFAYSMIIGIALAVLAYKTRKIERENYKDTKKIYIFIVSLFTLCITFIAFWGIFRFVGERSASTILASIGLPAVPILCQVFLICPKIIPGINRHFRATTDTIIANNVSKDTETTNV